MADSTLAATKTTLDEEIAVFLGFPRDATKRAAGTEYADKVDQARESGLRRFYAERDWSFLVIPTTLVLTAGDYQYDLPEDFGGMEENFCHAADIGYDHLVERTPGWILDQIADSDSNGTTKYFAIRAKSQVGTAGTRWEVLLYRPPQTAWTLYYSYRVLRNKLDSTNLYPAGGADTSEALTAACLAAADRLFNDNVGNQEQYYQTCLAKAKEADGRTQARRLGPMIDTSDMAPRRRYEDGIYDVEINGAAPS